MVYKIVISEFQRAALAAFLAQHATAEALFDGTEADEICVLRDMLSEMPAEEKANPGTLHGFCY